MQLSCVEHRQHNIHSSCVTLTWLTWQTHNAIRIRTVAEARTYAFGFYSSREFRSAFRFSPVASRRLGVYAIFVL